MYLSVSVSVSVTHIDLIARCCRQGTSCFDVIRSGHASDLPYVICIRFMYYIYLDRWLLATTGWLATKYYVYASGTRYI